VRVALLTLLLAGAAQAERAPVTLADIHKIADLAEPALSPDGSWVAYTAATHDLAKDATVSRIWLVRYDGTQRHQLTTGDSSESHARWTPDGSALVYLAETGDDEIGQVWARPLAGGAARQVTHIEEGVSDFALSPDGKRLALIAGDPKPKVAKDHPEPPFVTERFLFMDDDEGLMNDRRHHLYMADLADAQPKVLTPGPHDEWLPAWSPDGAQIAFVTKRGDDADRRENFDIWTVEARPGGAERQVTTFPGPDDDPDWLSRPDWSPDGKRIAYLQGGDLEYTPWQLTVIDLASRHAVQPAPIDRNFFQPRWAADGESIYARIEQAEDVRLARIDAATGKIDYLTPPHRYDSEFDISGDHIVVLGNDETAPYELFAVERALRPISHMNDDWRAGVAVQPDEDFTARSPDGTEIHGLLVRPAGAASGKRYPTILRVHGGPVYQFSHEFMFDWQYFAAQGYAVVAMNPRGSSGRGYAFANAIRADWGHVDVADVLAGVDHAVAAGIVDPDRLGVGGWSYGGILTDYVIASDRRFKAAIAGAGSGNVLGMYGMDEYSRDYETELGTPWHDTDTYLRLSYPFLHADRIATPTLFLCAGDDLNVPCGGAEQMYQALRSRDVPTRLIRFPKQHHELTVPSYLEFRLKEYGEWYDRFLKR